MARTRGQPLWNDPIDVIGASVGSGEPASATLRHADWPGWRFGLVFNSDGALADFRIRYDAGESWNGDPRRMIPTGGPTLTARMLKQVPLGALERAARSHLSTSASRQRSRRRPIVDDPTPALTAWIAHLRGVGDSLTLSGRPGRRGRAPLDYAVLSAVYVEALDRSAKPVEETAAALSLAPKTVRNALHEARVRRLLTPPPAQGKAGGELTSEAKELLDAAGIGFGWA